MILVFLFIFLLIIILTVIVLIFSKIKIEIIDFNVFGKIPRTLVINEDYKIIIKLVVLKKLPIVKLELTKEKLKRFKLKDKMKSANIKAMKILKEDKTKNKNVIKAIKNLDVAIQDMNLEVKIGTENASFTAILVAIISTLISMLLKKHIKKYKSQTFKIQPLYYNQNLVNIEFSGIFEIKMIHIINIIYILNKKEGVKKYERTSNRRTYAYSYE